MGGEGSILAMITSLKNNNAWRPKRRRQFKGQESMHPGNKPLAFENKMTPAQFEEFQLKLRQERHFRDLRRIALALMALILGGLVIYLIYLSLAS